MKEYKVAVLGATGAVGQEMLKILAERRFPVSQVKALASARSAGKRVYFADETLPIEEATAESFKGMDIVLGAVGAGAARAFRPAIMDAGAVFVDNSSAFRMDEDVPLVVPEINPEDALRHHGVIANPNCSTIITMVAVNGIQRVSPIEAMVASTYQAVSGAGREGIDELEAQIAADVQGADVETHIFPCRIHKNVIPMIGDRLENGYTTEEMKMQNEGRKILHNAGMNVCCTCVRVPVIRSHSISVQLRTRDAISVEQAMEAIRLAPGCVLAQNLDGRDYPTPLDTSDQDQVYVGRVRRDLIFGDRGLSLWCCGDQIRKGAATNAVQIAELLTK